MISLTSTIDGGGVWGGGQRHTLAALPPGKGPRAHCTGGCVGPSAGLDGCRKRRPYRDSIPEPSSP
jgi:hypothetical protein